MGPWEQPGWVEGRLPGGRLPGPSPTAARVLGQLGRHSWFQVLWKQIKSNENL